MSSPNGVEGERLLERRAARLRVARERADAVEALERELPRDLWMVSDERRVVRLDDRQLVLETFGIGEAEEPLAALASDALLPEVERVGRGDSPDDAVHHAGAGASGRCVRILEERDVRAGAALLVCVEQVVDRRVVLVHGLLHEPQAKRASVVVDVLRRVPGDAGDVMHAFELHPSYRTLSLSI